MASGEHVDIWDVHRCVSLSLFLLLPVYSTLYDLLHWLLTVLYSRCRIHAYFSYSSKVVVRGWGVGCGSKDGKKLGVGGGWLSQCKGQE